MTTTLTRRAILAGALALPALAVGNFHHAMKIDPKAPKVIAWPAWAGHDRAGMVMTAAELAERYSGNPRRLRYALRRLARYQAEQVLS